VKSVDLRSRHQRHCGSIALQNGEGRNLLGFAEAKDGKVCRFNLIVKGINLCDATSHALTPLGLVPMGKKVRVGLAFMLADPKDELAKFQPRATRDCGGGGEK
jgi:hypothetical protein